MDYAFTTNDNEIPVVLTVAQLRSLIHALAYLRQCADMREHTENLRAAATTFSLAHTLT